MKQACYFEIHAQYTLLHTQLLCRPALAHHVLQRARGTTVSTSRWL